MIRDLYDNCIVVYKTETEQTVNLVLDTIRLAMEQEKKRVAEELQLHSDQEVLSMLYKHILSWLKHMALRRLCQDEETHMTIAMAENFFSILKTECIYRRKPAPFSEANEMIDRYIYFYNHERIQLKTREVPLARRLSY